MGILHRFTVAAALSLSVASAFANGDSHGNFALAFKGSPGLASTAPGSPLTLQDDNLRLEATVKWAGPPSQTGSLIYNGHGCCSGWGILMLGEDQGVDAHKIAVLAGGIILVASPLTLPVGKWARVTMERRAQVVTLTVDGLDKHTPPQTFNFGTVPVNPLGVNNGPVAGGTVRTTEKVSIGENFNGLIDDVKFRTLDTRKTLESWQFNDVAGFITTGSKANTLLNLNAAAFITVSDDDDEDDDDDDDDGHHH